ncbi:putative pectinesterase 11 [Euphorbia lathyris]|uniref:putative pectinesterase 11 n=1 Tax=Euphorbia lathyris TaxID=212925 RepID=UPI003313129F
MGAAATIMKICCFIMMILSHNISGAVDLSNAILIRVDQSGKGDFTKIQDAIDSVPSNNSELVFIWVKPGTYSEKIVVPGDKPFITISGTNPSKTIITWNEGGNIMESPTFSVLASDFVGRYLTIQNTYGSGDKAVALRVSGDRVAFYGCRILSYQDTLLDDAGSHYYSNCYIEGATDFICGNAASLFERCHVHSISKNNGSITAQHRDYENEKTGFVFKGCRITGSGSAYLGRPWGEYSRVIYAETYMSSAIVGAGWETWSAKVKNINSSKVMYGEYKCYGPGADRSKRVQWSHDLSTAQAAPFLTKDIIGGQSWLRSSPNTFTKASTIPKPTN